MKEREIWVFYDGECPFCVGWVKFLLDRDGENRLRFAALQGNWATAFFEEQGMPHPGLERIAAWDGDRLHLGTAAISAIGGALSGIWRGIRYLERLPEGMREGLYRFVARHRYRLMGRYGTCWIPKTEDRKKFLDQ